MRGADAPPGVTGAAVGRRPPAIGRRMVLEAACGGPGASPFLRVRAAGPGAAAFERRADRRPHGDSDREPCPHVAGHRTDDDPEDHAEGHPRPGALMLTTHRRKRSTPAPDRFFGALGRPSTRAARVAEHSLAVSTCAESKPPSSASSAPMLRARRPAPARSTTAADTCAMTSVVRRRRAVGVAAGPAPAARSSRSPRGMPTVDAAPQAGTAASDDAAAASSVA